MRAPLVLLAALQRCLVTAAICGCSISVAFYRQTGLAALQPRTTFLRKQLALFRSGPCKFLFDSAGATKSLSCSRPAFGGGIVSATRPLGLRPETGRFAYLDWMNSFV